MIEEIIKKHYMRNIGYFHDKAMDTVGISKTDEDGSYIVNENIVQEEADKLFAEYFIDDNIFNELFKADDILKIIGDL